MSHWDGPAVAEKLNASVYAVWRVLRREGIYAFFEDRTVSAEIRSFQGVIPTEAKTGPCQAPLLRLVGCWSGVEVAVFFKVSSRPE